MSRILRLVPPAAAPLAALARALALAVGDATDWARVSLDELQALGAPPPCEVGTLMAVDRASTRMHGSPLRAHTAGRVVWRYEREPGSPARFSVRPWPTPQDIHRHPPALAPLDRTARRALIAEVAERRRAGRSAP